MQLFPFEKKYEQGVIDLILTIQQLEFQVPITINEQQDLLDIPNFYQVSKGGFWIVVNEADEVVASIALIDCGEGVGALRKMFVKKEYRGKEHQLAQRLHDVLSDFAHEKKYQQICLGTLERLGAARRFYERNGWDVIEKADLPTNFLRMEVDTHFYRLKIVRKIHRES